jgi:hypothetical protein
MLVTSSHAFHARIARRASGSRRRPRPGSSSRSTTTSWSSVRSTVSTSTTTGLHVVDYKTNRKARTRAQVRVSLQLAIYALATRELYGRAPGERRARLRRPRRRGPRARRRSSTSTRSRGGCAGRAAHPCGRGHADPHRLCDWCDFRSICPAWTGEGGTEPDGGPRPGGEGAGPAAPVVVRDARRLQQLDEAVAARPEGRGEHGG